LLNERINAALMKIEANKKVPKKSVKSLSEEVINENGKKGLGKMFEEFKLDYKEFVKENQDKIKNEWEKMLNLLEFEKLFENLASNGPVNTIKLIREEFGALKLNLSKMGGEEAYDKLEEHFKQFEAKLHFERFNFTN